MSASKAVRRSSARCPRIIRAALSDRLDLSDKSFSQHARWVWVLGPVVIVIFGAMIALTMRTIRCAASRRISSRIYLKLRADSDAGQVVRQTVRPVVQFSIGDVIIAED